MPTPDKQYHNTVDDDHLQFQFGDIQMVIENGDELNWGIPPQPKGREFMIALVTELKTVLAEHPEY